MGVCSVFDNDHLAVTCPIRFRQNWLIADDGAEFFFPQGAKWTSLTEVRLKDKHGKSAGNIDLVSSTVAETVVGSLGEHQPACTSAKILH